MSQACRTVRIHLKKCSKVQIIWNGKVKVKLSLCLTKHHDMKLYREVEVQHHTFLTSALDAGEEWSASCPGHFTPRE
jgi:hypothetical protein